MATYMSTSVSWKKAENYKVYDPCRMEIKILHPVLLCRANASIFSMIRTM